MNAIEANAILWRIAKLCGRSRITQGELAQACGLSSSAVNRSLAKTTSDPISRPLAILLSTWNAHPETIPPYLKEDTPPRRQK